MAHVQLYHCIYKVNGCLFLSKQMTWQATKS